MKIVFTFFLLTCLLANSMAQNTRIKIGSQDFKTILFDNPTIYLNSCENRFEYLFTSQFLVEYDSMMHIGYIGSYLNEYGYNCLDSMERSVMEQIKSLLTEKRKVHNKICVLIGMEDKNKEFIGFLMLFKRKKFKKFTNKANSPVRRAFSGEVILMHNYEYSKYAKEFILAKIGNELSLIKVNY